MLKKYFGIFLVLIFAVSLFGCGGGGKKTTQTLTTITISPTSATVVSGAAQTFTVKGYDQNSAEMSFTPVFTVTASDLGTVTLSGQNGIFTAVKKGTGTIKATGGNNISATAQITVQTGSLNSLIISPTQITLYKAQTQQFTVYGIDAQGNAKEKKFITVSPTWSVIGDIIGTIDNNGLFTATLQGTGQVKATVTNTSITADVTVPNRNPVITSGPTANPSTINTGQTSTISVTASDPDNDTLTYTWTKTGGTITGTGSSVTYTAPNTADTYTITVVVSDEKGGSVSGNVNVVVTYTMVQNLNHPGNIDVDSINIYIAETGTPPNYLDGTIKSIPKAGGPITTLASNQVNPVRGLATDGTDVYWSEHTTSGDLKKVPVGGGTITTLISGLNKPYGSVLDSANTYWSEWGGGTIKSIPKTGGTPTIIVSSASYPCYIVVDSTNLYWSEGSCAQNLKSVAKSGGTPTTFYTSPSGYGLAVRAVDSNYIYFHEHPCGTTGAGSIKKIPISGGTATTLASGINSPYDLDVDSIDVYICEGGTSPNYTDGAIKKVPISGGTVTTLLSGLTYPVGIKIDNTNIYWLEYGTSVNNYTDGKLRKMAK